MTRLDKAADLIGASRRVLVSQTSRGAGAGRRVSCDLAGFLEQMGRVSG
jgi:hypothetical protein